MDYIKLVDGTQITILDGGALGSLNHIAASETDALAVCAKLTNENVEHLEFYKAEGTEPYGIYDDIILAHTPTRATKEDGESVTVWMSFRTKTMVEKTLDRIAEEQEMQNDAINELLMA